VASEFRLLPKVAQGLAIGRGKRDRQLMCNRDPVLVWFKSRLGQGLGFQFWMTVMGAVLASSVTVFIRNR
jgi:hypothetical protein